MTHPPGEDSVHGQRYDTPRKDGPVTMVSADGDTIVLKATDGSEFTFDVATETFKT